MSWKPENFSGYSFSEYNSQPAEQDAEQADYTDPRFYEATPAGASRSAQASLPQPTGQFSSPYTQDQRSDADYGTEQMNEYRGPETLEHYTSDAGAEQREAAQNGEAQSTKKRGLAGLGGLGAAIALVLKFGLAGITALISIGAYALIFGWPFAVGFVALLFIHEMGHAVIMKLKGIPIGGMIFIPLLGAAVIMRNLPHNARDEAEIGIAGPIAGALAAGICLIIARTMPGTPGIWASLAYFGFFLNFFNLIPIVPFDGGRVLAAIDRRIWIIGFAGLVGFQLWQWLVLKNNPSIWLLIFTALAASQLWFRTQDAKTPEAQAYYTVPLSERIALGVAYFALAGALVLGMSLAQSLMPYLHPIL